ncbi:MAG TPA: enoyl-CoA hydratase/isomerase family protein [Candidatus Lustribacter sp.]|nr:enoyl-CoA hydratase/isomerase family protein [Candidatus Lustribacter sp.]
MTASEPTIPTQNPADQSSPHPALRVTRTPDLVTVTLCDPRTRNAQTPSLWLALAEVARSIGPGVRVVIIDAEGESFSAGLHRGMLSPGGLPGEPPVLALAAGDRAVFLDAIAGFQEGFTAWAQIPAVVIAAVQGHAIGAGLQLALGADLRVVADDVAFAMREPSLGMIPDMGGTHPLVRLVGYARALEICATGRFVHADEAVRIGLATVAVPAGALGETARELAGAMLAAHPGALRELKPLLQQAVDGDLASQLRAEREAQARLLGAAMAAPRE